MKASFLILIAFASLIAFGQKTQYDKSLLVVSEFNKEAPSIINGPSIIKGRIPVRPEGILGDNEKYIDDDIFIYGNLSINKFPAFIYSENFAHYIKHLVGEYTNYLVINSGHPYQVRVLYRHIDGPITISSFLHDNILIVKERTDHGYDIELEGQGDISYMSRFVVIEFQDDGGYKVLNKDKALTLALELEPDTFRNIELL